MKYLRKRGIAQGLEVCGLLILFVGFTVAIGTGFKVAAIISLMTGALCLVITGALSNCPKCGRSVSPFAKSCGKCGCSLID